MKARGFTVIELLVVILIIAILASVAIPAYIKTVEKARAGEAIVNLELIRDGEKGYRLEFGEYTNGTFTGASVINNTLKLNIEPRFWTYEVASDGSTFTATATRQGGRYNGTIITIDQDGIWGGGGNPSLFVPSN